MPMIRRVPKRGFHNKWGVEVFGVNVGDLEKRFDDGDEVTLESLAEKDLAKGSFDEVKILGDGELTKKLTVTAHRFSKQAEEKITKAGGTVQRIAPKRTPEQRVAELKSQESS